MNNFFSLLSLPFFQNALLVGILAGIAAGIIGSLIILKKISFLSGSIAHASFGGLGIAYYFGLNPILGAIVFSVLSALGMGVISSKTKKNEDALIGALWAVGMAIGIIFVALTPGYAADLFTYLFGNILLTTQGDIWLIAILDLLVLISVAVLFRYFLSVIFDEEFSRMTNVPVLALNLYLLALVALTIVILIKVVGTILVIALLTMPAATANLISKQLRNIIILSILLSVAATVSGIFLSYYLNWPTGPVIIFICAFFYIFTLLVTRKTYFFLSRLLKPKKRTPK